VIAKAIHAKLNATASVTSKLATYDFGDGAVPAIFTVDPIPKDAALPAIVITLVGGIRDGSRGQKGVDAGVDVRVWGDRKRSTATLRALAWAIWEALERAPLTIDGYEEVGCRADPPQALTDPDGFPGYLVAVRVRAYQS